MDYARESASRAAAVACARSSIWALESDDTLSFSDHAKSNHDEFLHTGDADGSQDPWAFFQEQHRDDAAENARDGNSSRARANDHDNPAGIASRTSVTCRKSWGIHSWLRDGPPFPKAAFLEENKHGHWLCDVNTMTGALLRPVSQPETCANPRDDAGLDGLYRRQNMTVNMLLKGMAAAAGLPDEKVRAKYIDNHWGISGDLVDVHARPGPSRTTECS